MKTKSLLFLITLVGASVLLSAGKANEHDRSRIVDGRFQGQVFNGDDMDPVLTTFVASSQGRASGAYLITEENRDVVGTLSNFKWESPYVLTCTWQDTYGSGTLRILFSTEYTMFRGFWGESDDTTNRPWDGVKLE